MTSSSSPPALRSVSRSTTVPSGRVPNVVRPTPQIMTLHGHEIELLVVQVRVGPDGDVLAERLPQIRHHRALLFLQRARNFRVDAQHHAVAVQIAANFS